METDWRFPAASAAIALIAMLFTVWKHKRDGPHVVLDDWKFWVSPGLSLIEVHVRNSGGSPTTVTAFQVVVPLSSTRNYVLEYQADSRPDARDHAAIFLDVSLAADALMGRRPSGLSAVIFRNRRVRVRAELAHGGSAGFNGPTGQEFADLLRRS